MEHASLTSYPRHYTYHGPNPHPPKDRPSLSRYHYSSDPTLLEETDGEEERVRSPSRGRRSAQDNYTKSEETHNPVKEARKARKKKLRRLRSFVHVFLGGLRRSHSIHVSDSKHGDVIAATRVKQRDERDGVAADSFSQALEGANTTATTEHRNALARSHSGPKSPGPGIWSRMPNGDIPGLCGLYNHGNTCFMNAVLQCLSNTDQLVEYFVTDHYKNDINRHKDNAKKFGTSGDVTEHFALLLKCLWSGQYDPRITARFKDVIGCHASQYQGTLQHDAQEFFLWLLDNMHEDLNQAAKKKYRPVKDNAGRPDEDVAAETLASHMKSNNSFIQSLFQGQFRSAIICPSCGTRSCTFDPYVCISVPLPQRETRPIYITVVYRSTQRENKVFGVDMSIEGSIRDLRNSLAELCGINRHHLVLCDLTPDGFNRTFYDDQHISVVQNHVFAFECPPYRGDNPEAHTLSNPSGSKELILLLVVNKFGQTQYGKRFGPPLILRVWRDLTHSQFQSVVLKAMAKYLREGVKLADACRSGILFRCRVMDGLPGRCILPTDVDHPFYYASIDKALSVSMLYGGPAHIRLVAEWEPETKASVFGVVPDQVPEPHESAAELRQYYQQPLQATLEDCLRIYTQEERLNREDSWYCPYCKHQQQDATKKITLWSLPDVLVLHLKRFRQVGYSRTKLSTLVQFPTSGLNMSPYLTNRSTCRPSSAMGLHERIQIGSSKTLPSKSVRFQDEVDSPKKAQVSRSASSGGSKFHLPWKKHTSKKSLKSDRSKSPEVVYSPALCDSPSSVRSAPSSVRSAPSAIGNRLDKSPRHAATASNQSRSPSHRPLNQNTASLEDSHLDNMYDLYAVCNHLGSMSRGHYTAYCKSPADGGWYMFDDMHVQPALEEQLSSPGVYMLFYVRQSLVMQSPLSSSDSSTSSGSSMSHWIYRIPQFRLNLGEEEPKNANMNEAFNQQQPRPRLGSTNSAVSAPPTVPGRGVSPQSSAHDNDDVFLPAGHQPSNDTQSALSLPPYHPNPNVRGHVGGSPRMYRKPPNYQQTMAHMLALPTQNRLSSGRHPSLRLGKQRVRHESHQADDGHFKRGSSFHAPRHHHVEMYDTLPVRHHDVQYPLQQPSVMPSRSIPNMSADMSPQLSRAFPEEPSGMPFMTPQPLRQRSSSYSGSKAHFVAQSGHHLRAPIIGTNQAESCV